MCQVQESPTNLLTNVWSFLDRTKFIEETSNDPSCNHIVVVFSGAQTPAARPSKTDVPFVVIKF